MLKLAANLTMLFTDLPFLDRFAAAKAAGFRYVEFLFPYDYSPEQVKEALTENDLQVVLFNLPSGDWAGGERGLGAHPGRIDEFRAGVDKALTYAAALGVPQMNCLAGKVVPGYTHEAQWQTLVDNVRYAGQKLAEQNLRLVVEPINRFDIPGFFLNRTDEALRLLEEVGLDNVFIQYDVYHAQREEGELVQTLRNHLPKIAHIQIADNPGRHQPGTGEINYKFVFAELSRLGYEGYIGLEYNPEPDTTASLGWIGDHGLSLGE